MVACRFRLALPKENGPDAAAPRPFWGVLSEED
jgi:hypothetical protein